MIGNSDKTPGRPLIAPDLARLLLRLAVGGLMLLHGLHKVQHGLGSIEGMLADKGLPAALAYGTYAGEVLAPILMLLGLFGRIGALLVAFTMGMSIWLAYGGGAFAIDPQYGALATELNWLYLAGALAVFLLGSGRLSVRGGQGAWD